jgi:hypothetical protein
MYFIGLGVNQYPKPTTREKVTDMRFRLMEARCTIALGSDGMDSKGQRPDELLISFWPSLDEIDGSALSNAYLAGLKEFYDSRACTPGCGDGKVGQSG